jgi:DNA-binding CsgD family transcriptional regulator
VDEARAAVDTAAAAHRAAGATTAVGRCALSRSRLHWFAGDGEAAWREAQAAVGILEPLGATAELARACSAVSQLAMLADRPEETLHWGRRAAELAQRAGDDAARAHALINIGTVESGRDPDDTAALDAAHRLADACGDRHEAVRALANGAWSQLLWLRPAEARRRAEQAAGYARAHEVDTLGDYVEVTLAWLRLREGDWAAAAVAEAPAEQDATVTQLLARTVLAERAVRRGDADAVSRLDQLARQADRTGELQRIEPVLELEVERALTGGSPLPLARIERATALAAQGGHTRWGGGRLAAWAAVAGVRTAFRGPTAPAYEAMTDGNWAAAADAFGAVGWTYDRALLLSLLDDAASLAEALEVARSLGAAPLERRVRRRMRALGMAVRHGRRESTRANPAGLTERQLEVVRLLAEGLTNGEIAERLVVSPRTAEHHVAAVLTKLGAVSRRDAARRASELRLLAHT